MADDQRSLAITQVVIPGVALMIAGPVFAARFSSDTLSVALGVVAAAVGVGLLVFAYFRYRGNRA